MQAEPLSAFAEKTAARQVGLEVTGNVVGDSQEERGHFSMNPSSECDGGQDMVLPGL